MEAKEEKKEPSVIERLTTIKNYLSRADSEFPNSEDEAKTIFNDVIISLGLLIGRKEQSNGNS